MQLLATTCGSAPCEHMYAGKILQFEHVYKLLQDIYMCHINCTPSQVYIATYIYIIHNDHMHTSISLS